MNTTKVSPPSTPKKKFSLHRPGDARWKWMAGSTAALGASTAMAGTVQISLADSKLTLTTNTINADFTGDGKKELPNLSFIQSQSLMSSGLTYSSSYFQTQILNVVDVFSSGSAIASSSIANAKHFKGKRFASSNKASEISSFSNFSVGIAYVSRYEFGTGVQDISGLVPVTFTDGRVNGGAPTVGLLHVRAFNTATNDHTVEFVRFIFDDASTDAPEVDADDPDFDESPVPAQNAADRAAKAAKKRAILRKIKKLKVQLKKAKRSKNKRKIKSFKKKIKKEKLKLRRL